MSNQRHDFLPEWVGFGLAFATRHSLGVNFFSGCGLALALPPLGFVTVGVFCFALLVMRDSLRRLPGPGRLWLEGLLFGFGYFCVALHWIGFAFLVDAKDYLWMMPFAVGGLAVFLSVYWALAFLAAGWLGARGFAHWMMLPLCLAVAELGRGYFFTGFPWAAPGLIADGLGAVVQFASLAGQPGLTLLVLLSAAAAGQVLRGLFVRDCRVLLPLATLALLPLAWGWGHSRVPSDADVTQTKVRLVQPNLPQSDDWRSEHAVEIFEKLVRLSDRPGAPDLVIWPESAVPFLLDESANALGRLDAVLDDGQLLLAGSLRREKPAADCTGCEARYFTSILAINDGGKVVGSYDKWRLVPGGEFLPLAWLLEPLGFRKVVSLPEGFTSGRGPANLSLPGIGQATMLICYEAIFPDRLVPEGARPGLIVNVTNDGWFGRSTGPYQHLAQVRLRAIEQGLPVVRAANTGISAVIDAYGRIQAASSLDVEGVIDAPLPTAIERTLFSKFGFWAATVAMIGLFAIAGFARRFNAEGA